MREREREKRRERWMVCGVLGVQAQQSLWMQISGMLKEGVRLSPAGFLALCGIASDESKARTNLSPPALPATPKTPPTHPPQRDSDTQHFCLILSLSASSPCALVLLNYAKRTRCSWRHTVGSFFFFMVWFAFLSYSFCRGHKLIQDSRFLLLNIHVLFQQLVCVNYCILISASEAKIIGKKNPKKQIMNSFMLRILISHTYARYITLTIIYIIISPSSPVRTAVQRAVPAKSFHMAGRKSSGPVISRWIPVPCCGFYEKKKKAWSRSHGSWKVKRVRSKSLSSLARIVLFHQLSKIPNPISPAVTGHFDQTRFIRYDFNTTFLVNLRIFFFSSPEIITHNRYQTLLTQSVSGFSSEPVRIRGIVCLVFTCFCDT